MSKFDEMRRALAKDVRIWRVVNELTQVQAAERLGISRRVLQKIEGGQPISVKTEIKVAQVIDTWALLQRAAK